MAGHRPWRRGGVVVASLQGFARAFARQPEKRALLDLARPMASRDRFDLPRLCGARLVRSDRAHAFGPPSQLAICGGGVVYGLCARPQYRRFGALGRGRAVSGLFRERAQRRRDRRARRLLLLHLCARRRDSRRFLPAVSPHAGRALRQRAALARSSCRGGAGRVAQPLCRRRASAFSPAQDRPLRTRLPASGGRGAATARWPSRTARRVRHHLFRASLGRQSRLRDRARRLCRLVFAGACEPRARRPRRARGHILKGDAGRAAGQRSRGLAGVPASLSHPAADLRAHRRFGL